MSFRKVIDTTSNSQIVEMNIPALGKMGREKIEESQKITLINGDALLLNNGELIKLVKNKPVVLPENSITDILNTSDNNKVKVIIEYKPARFHPRLEQTVQQK